MISGSRPFINASISKAVKNYIIVFNKNMKD